MYNNIFQRIISFENYAQIAINITKKYQNKVSPNKTKTNIVKRNPHLDM